MAEIIGDENKYFQAGQLQPKGEYGHNQFQPIIIEWNEIKEDATATVATDRITFSNADFNPAIQFTVGDRVRVFQDAIGAYMYFYLKATAATYIEVAQSLNNFLDTSAVKELAISKTPANGFPTVFEFEISASGNGSMDVIIDPPDAICGFHLIGDLVIVDVNVFGMEIAGTPDTTIYIDLPIDWPGTGFFMNSHGFGTDGDGTDIVFKATLESAPDNRIALTKVGGGNWASGLAGTLTFSNEYQI